MFGKMGDMMGKLKQMQQQSEEVKKRLDTVSVEGEAENGSVKVISTANRKITSIQISDELVQSNDKNQLEELTLIAVNRALDKAEKVAETEMQQVAKGMIPGM